MIYVMSDIHGNTRRFDSILKQIDLQPEDTLYILGDVIDRQAAQYINFRGRLCIKNSMVQRKLTAGIIRP